MRYLLVLLLTGCSFHEPLYKDRVSEAEACNKSAICRLMIDDVSPWVYHMHSDREDCVAHSTEIVEQARARGYTAGYAIGYMQNAPIRHSVAVIEHQGEQWIVDNGRISTRPFKPAELHRWMDRIVWTNDIRPFL